MNKQISIMLLDLLRMAPLAFLLSCGVNLQQYGYRTQSEFLMFLGVLMIAIALVLAGPR